VTLDKVTFSYPDRDPILKQVSLHIRPGEHIALVGVNGAGKSTLVKLLMGLYQPAEGTIAADHISYTEIDPATLRDNVSAAFQDYYNFEFTLAESIGIGKPASSLGEAHMDLSAVEEAAAAGGAAEVYNQMARGWNQPVGHVLDGGVGLSGGQWQRIALSRALMRKSQLLILDEPTAAMDPRNEAELYARFMTIMRDQSVFIVSHRLGSARIADRILVLSDGVIAEEGSHEQLLTAGGIYSRMWEEQAQWYKD
jgi:ATP-binding cassette subfamily B protein